MPRDFAFRYPEADLWTPLRLTPTSPWLQVAARLHAGVSVTQARSALEIVAHQMEQEERKDHSGLKIVVTPWRDMPDEKYKLTLIFVFAAVVLVILIACADVGSLLFEPRCTAAKGDYNSRVAGGRAMAYYAAVAIREPGVGRSREFGWDRGGTIAVGASD